jgi:hypothetical protein
MGLVNSVANWQLKPPNKKILGSPFPVVIMMPQHNSAGAALFA